MKWIGQNIWSFISRFRSDVYLEASVNPAADVDKFLVQGTDGKVGFRTGAEVLSDIGGSSTAGDITSVVAGTGLTGSSLTGGDATLNVIGGTGITANADDIAITAGGVDTTQLANNGVTEDKLADTLLAEIDANTTKNTSSNVFGTYIKLIPSDFMANDDGGNTRLGIGYVDTAGEADYGMRVSHNNTELFAFVSIPEGMKATHVEVFGRRAKAVEVFEVQINASTRTSKGTGTSGIPSQTIGDEEFAINNSGESAGIAATATNLLAIEVTVTSNSADKVYGGRVKIAAQ